MSCFKKGKEMVWPVGLFKCNFRMVVNIDELICRNEKIK